MAYAILVIFCKRLHFSVLSKRKVTGMNIPVIVSLVSLFGAGCHTRAVVQDQVVVTRRAQRRTFRTASAVTVAPDARIRVGI